MSHPSSTINSNTDTQGSNDPVSDISDAQNKHTEAATSELKCGTRDLFVLHGPQHPIIRDRTCPQVTRFGFGCRRSADSSGYCPAHNPEAATAGLIDPLEVIDWQQRARPLLAMGSPARSGRPDRSVVSSRREVSEVNDTADRPEPISAAAVNAEQMRADAEAVCSRVRPLRAVPDPDPDSQDLDAASHREGWDYERPDVLALHLHRRRYQATMPGLPERKVDEYVDIRAHRLSPKTIKTYEGLLEPYYRHCAALGVNPLTCDAVYLESYILHLMVEGKPDKTGTRDASRRYSSTYFRTLRAALRRAARVKGWLDPTNGMDFDDLLRGYVRRHASELPREAKDPAWIEDLVEIERRAREGSTRETARMRAIFAVGCHPELRLTYTDLLALTFADVAATQREASVACPDGRATKINLQALADDSACPVAALRNLETATRARLQASADGAPPTKAQITAQHLFSNPETGKPLTVEGLKRIISTACANIEGAIAAVRGKPPALTLQQRRAAIATNDQKMVRDLALLAQTAFSSARSGEIGHFNVGHLRVGGNHSGDPDKYEVEFKLPLVDYVTPDGIIVRGVLDRIAEITLNDLLDCDGNSLYDSRLIVAIHNEFVHGTKTLPHHDNWYPAQPGSPSCPVRLLFCWLKVYDRLMLKHHGRRLSCNDPLFCNLRSPGEPIKNMSRTAGQAVKSLMADLGHDPDHYAAHSLRKTRTTHVLNTGGNTLEDMKHAGRRSEAAGLPYAHRSPRNPVAADPLREVFDDVRQNESSDMHNATDPPPAPVSTDSEPAAIAQPPAPPSQEPATEVAAWLASARNSVQQMRQAGIDDPAIATLLGLHLR